MTRVATFVVAIGVAGLAVAGCSGSSKNSSAAAKAAYVAQANNLCDQVDKELSNMPTPGDPNQDPARLAAWSTYLDHVVARNEALILDLKAIPKPAGDEAKLNEFFAAADAHEREIEAAQQAAAANDLPKFTDLLQKFENDSTSFHDAEHYGLTRCEG